MGSQWQIYENGLETKTIINVFETTNKIHKRIELPDLTQTLKIEPYKIKKTRIFCDNLQQIRKYSKPKSEKSTRICVVKQEIETTDNRMFSRELQIRIDLSHSNRKAHLNIDVTDRNLCRPKKIKKQLTKNKAFAPLFNHIHLIDIDTTMPQYFSINVACVPGTANYLFKLALLYPEDVEFHKKKKLYLENRTNPEIKTQFHQDFTKYATSLQNRKLQKQQIKQ